MVRNFGHDLDGLVTVNLDKQAQYRSARQRARPAGGGRDRADRPSRDPAAAAARRRGLRSWRMRRNLHEPQAA